MASRTATKSPPPAESLPEAPADVTVQPLLRPNHWRMLLPTSLASSLLHAFFLYLAALITITEYVPPISTVPIDTLVVKVDEKDYQVRHVHEPEVLPLRMEPRDQPQVVEQKAEDPPPPQVVSGGNGEGAEFLPIVQPPESTKARSPDVVYVPTPQSVVDEMLRLAKVQPGNVVMDLGCGDGRIPITAVKDFGARGYGYDIDAQRIKESLDNASKQGVAGRVVFEQRDVFTLDLSRADVVTLYLLPSLNVKLIPQLQRMKPGTRVVTHNFDIEGIKPDLVKVVPVTYSHGALEHKIYVFTLPLKKVDGQPLDPVPSDSAGKLSVSEDEVLWNMLGIRATVVPRQGLLIDEVKPRSAASLGGVRAGDILRMLGGYDVHSKRSEAIYLIRLRPELMSFEVKRGLQSIEGSLRPDRWEP